MLAVAGPIRVAAAGYFHPEAQREPTAAHRPWRPRLSLTKVILISAAAAIVTGLVVWKWNHQSNLLARP